MYDTVAPARTTLSDSREASGLYIQAPFKTGSNIELRITGGVNPTP
jgi:hypothetical protein